MYPSQTQVLVRPKRKRLRYYLLAFALAMGVYHFLPRTLLQTTLSRVPALRLKDIVVTSEWPLPEAQVRQWLPEMQGQSILFLDVPSLIDRLEAKPWVKAVTVQKQFPDRLRVDVATKRAVAITPVQGVLYWLDSDGATIEKVTPQMLSSLELPVVSWEGARKHWDTETTLKILTAVTSTLPKGLRLSQILFDASPQFRVFLSTPRVEATFHRENWLEQLPRFFSLVQSVTTHPTQVQKMNLVFPKKAIVSPALSN